MMRLVESPALLEKATKFVKTRSVTGEKLSSRLVLAEAASENGVPERIVNGPGEMLAVPVRVVPPALLRMRALWVVAPGWSRLKSSVRGVTMRMGGVKTALRVFNHCVGKPRVGAIIPTLNSPKVL